MNQSGLITKAVKARIPSHVEVVYMYMLINDRCRRKEERSKQGHTNKARQHSTPMAVTFPKEK